MLSLISLVVKLSTKEPRPVVTWTQHTNPLNLCLEQAPGFPLRSQSLLQTAGPVTPVWHQHTMGCRREPASHLWFSLGCITSPAMTLSGSVSLLTVPWGPHSQVQRACQSQAKESMPSREGVVRSPACLFWLSEQAWTWMLSAMDLGSLDRAHTGGVGGGIFPVLWASVHGWGRGTCS